MKQSLNNVLSFLVTCILMFVMMFVMIKFSYEVYIKIKAQAEEILVIKEQINEKIEEILKDIEK
ncbi:MAG: hypothetical protein EOM19_02070 [Candidatus Moranbacteria bacterium]|nr:hypothetical protein [Candidatus Moranbacteria bacterium]